MLLRTIKKRKISEKASLYYVTYKVTFILADMGVSRDQRPMLGIRRMPYMFAQPCNIGGNAKEQRIGQSRDGLHGLLVQGMG